MVEQLTFDLASLEGVPCQGLQRGFSTQGETQRFDAAEQTPLTMADCGELT